jgi:hypothetical protein
MENYQTFVEKNLCLYFPNEYQVLKYDKSEFYKNLSNSIQNTKGVDFIVKTENKLFFIELSDYRGQIPPSHADLVDEVMEKIKGSLVGLFSAKTKAEVELLDYANCLFNNPIKEFVIIFVLKEDNDNSPFNNSKSKRANMSSRLKSKLENAFQAQFYVCDCSDFHRIQNLDFKIKSISST